MPNARAQRLAYQAVGVLKAKKFIRSKVTPAAATAPSQHVRIEGTAILLSTLFAFFPVLRKIRS
jgi:hypothetical protein